MRPILVLLLVVGAIASLLFAANAIFDSNTRSQNPAESHITRPAEPGGPDAATENAELVAIGDVGTGEGTRVVAEEVFPVPTGPNGSPRFNNELVGKVTDPKGAAIADAKVTIVRGSKMHQLSVLRDIMNDVPNAPKRHVVTGSDGEYSIRGIEPGDKYTVIVKHEEYSRQEVPGVRVPEEGQARYDVQLESGYMLTGFVRDAITGAGIEGAELRLENPLFAILPPEKRDKVPNAKIAHSDATGYYTFANVSSGNRNVSCTLAGYATQVKNNLYFQGEEFEVEQNFDLAAGERIVGRVVGPSSEPVVGATLQAISYSAEMASKGNAKTDETGRFEMVDLAEGAYALIIRADGYEDKREPRVEAGDHAVEIVLAEQGAVMGQVVDGATGKPLTAFACDVRQVNQGGQHYGRSVTRKNFRNVKEGRFELDGVPAGTYVVQATAQGYATTFSDPFQVQQGVTTPDVVVRMSQGGTLTGRVLDRYTGEPVVGAVITTHENKWIDSPFTNLLGSMMPRNATKAEGRTNEEGVFTLPRLTPHEYQVQINHGEYTGEVMNDVHVVDGEPTDLGTIKMSHGGVVRGTVYGADGRPVGGATITLSMNGTENVGRSLDTRSETDGRYLFQNVAGGTYKLSASRPPTGKGSPFDVIVDMKNSEIEVQVLDGRQYSHDLYLGRR